MAEPSARVRRLVSALAEDERVDWEAVLRRCRTAGERRVVTDLRWLARQADGAPPWGAVWRAGGLSLAAPAGALPAWAWLVMALAGLRVLLGLGGSVWAESAPRTPAVGLAALASVVFGVAAAWLLRTGRRDRRAVALGGFFLTVAAATAFHGAAAWTAVWPDATRASLALVPESFLPYFLWQFVRDFPRVVALSALDTLARRAAALSAGAGVVLSTVQTAAWLRAPHDPTSAAWFGGLSRNHPGGAYWVLVFLLAAPALIVVLLRAREAARAERRRVRLFALALCGGVAPLFVLVSLEALVPSVQAFMARPGGERLGALIVYLPLLTVPFTTAYAVLMSGLLEAPFARAWDRRPRVRVADVDLHHLGAELQAAGSPAEAQACLARHVTRVLPVDSVRLLACTGDDDDYHPLDGVGRPLPRASALAALVTAGRSALLLPPASPEFRWLPEAERCWLVDMGVQALVPLDPGTGAPRLLLALVAQRHHLRLSREQRLFLAALALPASSAWDHAAPSAALGPDAPAGACHVCRVITSVPGHPCACGRPSSPAAIPQLLNGKFLVQAVLGRGAMGVVYRATDLALGRDVALKTLPRVSALAALRLRAEARAMATLSHAHVAPIFGAETWRGVPVLVVEYLAGGTLAARLATAAAPFAVATVLEHGVALASALQALHDKGLVHRDVKPSNIGFTLDGLPKLLDFGLARLVAEAHQAPLTLVQDTGAETDTSAGSTTSVAGTRLYLPPEALRGQASGPAQDLWALALVLYEALAGHHPLRALDPDAGQRLLVDGRLPDVRVARPDCPPAVAHWLARALHARRARRPANARVLGLELARLRMHGDVERRAS